ncbi:MAG: retropepsin-like aspartic protease family protein [Cellvibrionaceae bacterium]
MHETNDSRPMGKGMLIIFWVLVLAVLTWGFGGWEAQKNNPNANPNSSTTNTYREVVLDSNRHHHYIATGLINRAKVTFLLDTGATDVVIPEQLANKLKLQKGASHIALTANGNVRVYATSIDHLQLGTIELRNVRASINPGMRGNEVLLGMSALSAVEFRQTNGQLILRQYN